MKQKCQKCAWRETYDLIDRIDHSHEFPVGTMMCDGYGKELEQLSITELYELKDALIFVNDEH